MKKQTILFLGALCSFSLMAQENVMTLSPSVEGGVVTSSQATITNKNKSNAVIWSEDFSGGIPTGWTNSGTSANALWEYRGPSTTPNTSVGSRGAYNGTRGPITSPTASNGFVIFDSDYRDNNGVAGAFGTGSAPTPHISTLQTGVIDLTGEPNVQLKIHSHMRYFAGRTLVAFSTDGGVTYPDTVRLYSTVPVNQATSSDELAVVNVSNYIGNSANAKIAFIYDGQTPEPGANGLGYYFWMFDDVSIETLPNNSLQLTSWNGAPAMDMIFANNSGPKYGHVTLDNAVPVSFDANVLNFGVNAQTDVQLVVDIYRDGNLETSLTSPVLAVLNSGDTATYNDLFTPQFTPTQTGDYEAVFSITSDSIPAQPGSVQPVDTPYTFFVTDTVTSLDFGTISNTIGTTQLGDDGSAMASLFMFDNNTPNPNAQLTVRSLDVYFSTSTVVGGDIQVEIYDSTGFDYTAGFGGAPLASVPFTVDATFPGNLKRLDLKSQNIKLDLDGGYYFVVYMFSNAGANTILIGNDQTVDQPGASSIMYNADDARWYSGYSAPSRSFESPIIRLNAMMPIGIEEHNTVEFNVFPNPSANGTVNLNIAEGGTYKVELVNLLGQTIKTTEVTVSGNEKLPMDYSSVAKGVYLMNVVGENGSKSVKLTLN